MSPSSTPAPRAADGVAETDAVTPENPDRAPAAEAAEAAEAASVRTRARFANAVATSGLTLDAGQSAAVAAVVAGDHRNLYLWGPVGRGKSMLAELYLTALADAATPELTDAAATPDSATPADATPDAAAAETASTPQVRRMHLHDLFRMLQTEIARDWRTPAVALDGILADTRALLIDEFHVHDIVDAMYLTALLQVADERGIHLIATSNYPPGGLLPDPQHHDRFLPTIARIDAGFTVVGVGSGPDHRGAGDPRRPRFSSGSWRVAPSETSTASTVALAPNGIPLSAVSATADEAVFTFAALCDSNVGVREYLWLADRFDRIVLLDVPDLATPRPEPLMRFTTLVVVLYDRDVRLDVVAAGSAARLADARRVPVDADRALSRLAALRG